MKSSEGKKIIGGRLTRFGLLAQLFSEPKIRETAVMLAAVGAYNRGYEPISEEMAANLIYCLLATNSPKQTIQAYENGKDTKAIGEIEKILFDAEYRDKVYQVLISKKNGWLNTISVYDASGKPYFSNNQMVFGTQEAHYIDDVTVVGAAFFREIAKFIEHSPE